jgi:hypothetical protein
MSNESQKTNPYILLNFLLLILTFTLNFLGHPSLKYIYLAHVLLALISIIRYDFSEILPIIFTMFFIEGQGRVLWDYSSWARIVFDSLIFLSIIKIFIRQKKLFDLKKIPSVFVILISLHFFWYLVEFTNLYSVSTFAVLGATKLYIYPILFFLGLSQIDIDIDSLKFQRALNFFLFLLFLELLLAIFQFTSKENLILRISPFYFKAMKNGVFTGMLFRPFGTTPLPGAISIFIFLTAGFLFFVKPTKLNLIIRVIIMGVSGYVLMLCQVRSALIKYIIIVFMIHLGEIIYSRFKAKGFLKLLPIFVLLFSAYYFLSTKNQGREVEINYVKDRVNSLTEVNKVKNSRLNIDHFLTIISNKLSKNPLGLGPGLTGASGSLSKDMLVNNQFVNQGMTWAFDNMIISLIIDFGVGALFYILMILYIPYFFLRKLITFYKNKNDSYYRILLICFSTICSILIGNWGAIGLTYNPESFVFWLLTAIGFSTIHQSKLYSEKHSEADSLSNN